METMVLGLLKRILMAAFVIFLIWWLVWGLTDSQIDSFQKHRAQWLGRAQDVQQTVETGYRKIKP